MSPVAFAFLFMLGCIVVPIAFMGLVGLIYLLCGKNPEDSWWYKLLNHTEDVSESTKEKIERDRQRIEEADRKRAEHEERMKAYRESQKVDRASCLTCSNRRGCDKTHCTGYSADPNIK